MFEEKEKLGSFVSADKADLLGDKESKAEGDNRKKAGTDLEDMIRAGLQFGHKTSRIHPKMKPYLEGAKNSVHIIDLIKTGEKLAEALDFIGQSVAQGKILLLVGTKIQMKDVVKETANDCNLPYINDRWLGGTLTNFSTIKKRIEHFQELQQKDSEGAFASYSKKERLAIKEELRKLEVKFGGIKDLNRIPDVLFVADIKKDHLAVVEAHKKGSKVVAITDTNVDPSLVDYPIPANDDAISSVKYILDKVAQTVKGNKKKAEESIRAQETKKEQEVKGKE